MIERDPAPPPDCPQCQGTGFFVHERQGSRYAVPCSCKKQGAPSSVPPLYLGKSLESFDRSTTNLANAWEVAVRFVEGFPDRARGLVFFGPPGVGKTHLACAILLALAKRTANPTTGHFVNCDRLLADIRGTFDEGRKGVRSSILDPVYDSDLVVFDGLGEAVPSDFALETWRRIIGYRYDYSKRTIVTTRFRAKESQSRQSESLDERIGPLAASRLHEMCLFVPLEGEDRRRNPEFRVAGNFH